MFNGKETAKAMKIKALRQFTGLFLLILALGAQPGFAQSAPEKTAPAAKPQETPPPMCPLKVVTARPVPLTVRLDDAPQKLSLSTRYGFERKTPPGKTPYVVIYEVSAIVFEDFLRVYNNFLLKRVGPYSRCDKLEIGKLEVNVDKNGSANGYFVGRYVDRTCLFLRFFDSKPRDIDRDMFVVYSAQGITGAKNTFTPAFGYDGKFYIRVTTAYEPIQEPSIFGRGGATLSGLYKEKLDNFLAEKEFMSLVENILPEKGQKTNKAGFKFASAAFLKNHENKIQLTFMLQRAVKEESACALRQKLLKGGFAEEK